MFGGGEMLLDTCVRKEAGDGVDDRCSDISKKIEAWHDGNLDLGAGW
jgi:hypothetical protein